MTFQDIVGAVARGWCDPKNQFKKMDVDLVIAIAKEVQKLYTSAKPAQKTQENVHVIDGADWPAPDSGFAKLEAL